MNLRVPFACLIALATTPAVAAHISFSPGHFEGRGSGLGGFGRGGGSWDSSFSEVAQERFETRFTDLMTEYDDGLAEIEDYYASDDYADVVDDVERLADRYDGFVTGVERSIDRLGNVISAANERVDFLNELLTDYQARDDLSETRLQRIEDWITGMTDRVQLGIDLWTERQSTLTEDLATYQEFQSRLTTYLDQIVTAGGGTVGDGDAESALAATAGSTMDVGSQCVLPTPNVSSAVPEPGGVGAALTAATALVGRRMWGRQRPHTA